MYLHAKVKIILTILRWVFSTAMSGVGEGRRVFLYITPHTPHQSFFHWTLKSRSEWRFLEL